MDARPIFLCGMMGSGKSTVGRLLAQRLKRRHVDLDSEIEVRQKMSIPDIFRLHGEAAFRKMERALLNEASGWENTVISLGGGSVQTREAVELVKESGLLIFLDAPLSVLLERLERDSSRPLLHAETDKSLRSRIEELLEYRNPYYLQSHIVIPTDQLSPESVTDTLIEKIESYES